MMLRPEVRPCKFGDIEDHPVPSLPINKSPSSLSSVDSLLTISSSDSDAVSKISASLSEMSDLPEF